MRIEAGATGVDYSYARPAPATLTAKGYTFVCRYIADTTSSPKVLQPLERDRLLANGLAIVLVWETTATRPLTGANAGSADGTIATQRALALGYPLDCPIIIAVDTDVYSKNINIVEQYVRAFAHATRYPVGIYGDTDILLRCNDISSLGWLPNASGWSPIKDDRYVHVKQGREDLINGWDPNVAIKPFTAWSSKQTAPPVVTPPVVKPPVLVPPSFTDGDDMPTNLHVTCAGQPELLISLDGAGATLLGLSSPEDRDQIVAAAKANACPVTETQYAAFVALAQHGDGS